MFARNTQNFCHPVFMLFPTKVDVTLFASVETMRLLSKNNPSDPLALPTFLTNVPGVVLIAPSLLERKYDAPSTNHVKPKQSPR